jgi:hypothetical protein
MKTSTTIGIFCGALVTYTIVAACASSGGHGGWEGGVSGLADAMTDPVATARAAPALIAHAACDQHAPNGAVYARAAFPGKDIEQLSSVRVFGQLASPRPIGGEEYTHRLTMETLLRPGSVAVVCGIVTENGTEYAYASPLTFVLTE